MNKLMKKIVTGALALSMVLGTVLSVSAAAPPTPPELQTDGKAILQKVLQVPPGVAEPDATFTFKFKAEGIISDTVGDEGKIIGSSGGTDFDTDDMPVIPDAVLNSGTSTNLTPTAPDLGFDTYTGNTGDVLASIATTAWPHAGVYVYTVTEDKPTSIPNMKYSEAIYEMYVYVENTFDNSTPPQINGLEVTNVGFRYIHDDGLGLTPIPTPEASAIVNSGIKSTAPKDEPIFTNRYVPPVDLEVTKEVAGKFADTTKKFTYTLVITRPQGAADASTAVETYIGTIYNGTTATTDTVTVTFAIGDVNGVVTSTTTAGGVSTDDHDFLLSHGQKLDFLDTPSTVELGRTGLPAGSTYTLTEQAEARYDASVKVWNNIISAGTPEDQATSFNVNTAVTISSTTTPAGNLVLGEEVNRSEWTNTYLDVTPTGIILNNLPFILLILVAVGGFVGYIVSKRRKATR